VAKRPLLNIGEVIKETEFALIGKRPPDRFSGKYATVVDYLKSDEFRNAKTAYQQRVLRQAVTHPTWTLDEARGHSKPTGNKWQVSSEKGLLQDQVVWKSRKEESLYAEYLNNQKAVLNGELNYAEFAKKWKNKTFTDSKGQKHKAITDREVLTRLAEFDELPAGPDVYEKEE